MSARATLVRSILAVLPGLAACTTDDTPGLLGEEPGGPGEVAVAPGPCTEELHRADFGLVQRYERRYHRRLLVDETYRVFDPSLVAYSYQTIEDFHRTLAYDGGGRLLAERYDGGVDGVIDRETTSRYDVAGRLVELVHTGDGFGPLAETFAYDAAGHLREHVSEYESGVYRERHELTPAGQELLEEHTWNDVLDRRVTFTYDASGRLIARDELDPDGALVRTYRTTFRHGASGLESALATSDFEGDGLVDRETTITYGALGLPTELVEDQPLDGRPDAITRITYDEHGRKRDELFIAAYVSPDTVGYHTSWSYDEDGRLLTEIQHPDQWTTATRVTTSTYDGAGRLIRTTATSDGAPVSDELTDHDAAGRRVRVETRHAGGPVDFRATWAFDPAGNLLRHAEDFEADGREDTWTTYAYDCFDAAD